MFEAVYHRAEKFCEEKFSLFSQMVQIREILSRELLISIFYDELLISIFYDANFSCYTVICCRGVHTCTYCIEGYL